MPKIYSGDLTKMFDISGKKAVIIGGAGGFGGFQGGFGGFGGADFGGGRSGFSLESRFSFRLPFSFRSSSKMAGRSSLGIAGKAAICASVALMRPVRISSCAPGTASSAASMPCEYFSARRTVFSPTPCSEAMR